MRSPSPVHLDPRLGYPFTPSLIHNKKTMQIFDIFLLEAVLNGLLFGGVLALLALGLNLIFGVIDVVWICYAELIMIGMYAVYYLHAVYGWPLWLAFPSCIVVVSLLGVALHQFVIRPVLAAEPINQLLVTGGVLFFLQGVATLAFGVEFKSLGVQLPPLQVGELFLSSSRLVAFVAAQAGPLVWFCEALRRLDRGGIGSHLFDALRSPVGHGRSIGAESGSANLESTLLEKFADLPRHVARGQHAQVTHRQGEMRLVTG